MGGAVGGGGGGDVKSFVEIVALVFVVVLSGQAQQVVNAIAKVVSKSTSPSS